MPPLTGSNVSNVVVRPRGPSHWAKSSGSVWALKTSSRGASNSLVMKRSCLPGSTVMIVLFFDDILFLLFLNFLQNFVETIKTLVPKLLKGCDPVENGPEPFRVDSIHALTAHPPFAHQPNLLQDPQVFR